MNCIKKYLILLFLIIYSATYAQDAQEIIKKVQSKYENITDAKATFTRLLKVQVEKPILLPVSFILKKVISIESKPVDK